MGSVYILSMEVTTQGDNLTISFYALGTTPPINSLRNISPNISQVCLADDVTGAGTQYNLKMR